MPSVDGPISPINGKDKGKGSRAIHETHEHRFKPDDEGIKRTSVNGHGSNGVGKEKETESWGTPLRLSDGGQDVRNPRRFPRISLPVEMMRDSYDVVVIGTGYGGGVAASRMARGKQTVCVLERGKERWPGEFPETLPDAAKELHVSGEFAPGDRRSIPGTLVEGGNPTGLYHFVVGEGQNVYMANGLGGTSLVNANVFLEPTPAVLEMDFWPEELRGRKAWNKYYERAKQVLEPAEYPDTSPDLLKAKLLQKQAELMGYEANFRRTPQTTRFQDGPNSTGVYMRASTLTGMDATGINDGSKSTTLVNYLSDAWNWGSEIFCECEVRYVTNAPDREGYIIWFAWHSSKRGRFRTLYDDLMWVHAKKLVFFGAGSLGTTEILLRSKQLGLSMSNELGTEMSGNGDMLGFGYNTDFVANCMAHPDPPQDRPVGPCITSVLDMRDKKNPLEGFVVEDCAIPLALGPFMLPMLTWLPDQVRPKYDAIRRATKAAAWAGSRYFGPYFPDGSVARTPAYLIMSHDSSQGSLTLKKDKPVLVYSGVGRSASVSRIHEFLEKMTDVVGGNFIANPAWTLLGAQEITVHPIGGARVSSDGTGNKGVVNSTGEIFRGGGSETHQGLIVCDGSAVPAAVGVNPFATITALAERFVDLVAQKYGIEIDYETKNGKFTLHPVPQMKDINLRLGDLDLFGKPAYPAPRKPDMDRLATTIAKSEDNGDAGIGFSEVMSGYIYASGNVADFDIAAKLARGRCQSARFFLTVKSWDTDELINNSRHPANLTGTFCCEALGGTFLVHRGTFQLFSQDPREPDTANLVYNFDMVSPNGTKLHFNGYKVVNSTSFLNPFAVWRQTTTLYVTITRPDSEVVGRGTLHIQPFDFVQELQTFEASGPTVWSKLSSTASFLTYFGRQIAAPFFSTLGRLQWPSEGVNSTSKVTAPSATYPLTATDGEKSTLHMWNPVKDGQQIEGDAPTILFVPGAAVDHSMFALPTIEKNAITYFREAGYRSYCLTHRVGRTPVAQKNYTPYDARRDIHAALAYIRDQNNSNKIYVIAHCAGSLALSCGLLDGTIPGEWLSGITASMVFMNPKFGKVNNVLSRFPLAVYEKLIGSWWDCCSSPEDSYVQQLLNQVLRLYPAGSGRETCRSVVCHRSELAFGRLWTHKNLNEATHRNLDRFLGGTSMRSLGWLMRAGRVERVITNEPGHVDLVTPENIDRLKGIPILFLSGTGNMVFTAENTDMSFTTLCNAHGKQWYEREVFAGKGHLDAWMGANAYQDVYPRVQEHVDAIMKM
ncbi:Fc.00g025450.m01.CDS01 [Cosmosporella sp. VM-42]